MGYPSPNADPMDAWVGIGEKTLVKGMTLRKMVTPPNTTTKGTTSQ